MTWITWLGVRLGALLDLWPGWRLWRRIQACSCTACVASRGTFAAFRERSWWQARDDMLEAHRGTVPQRYLYEILDYAFGRPPVIWRPEPPRAIEPGCTAFPPECAAKSETP